MRTLIYARYSSHLQKAGSIEDQIAACRRRAQQEGWPIVDVYSDAAISGAAGIESGRRPGFEAMLARVEAGGIDQVLVDTTSRLARDQGDAHQIRKLINYAGARLFTLGDGEIDAFKGAIKGLLDEQLRVEQAHNVRRGQIGNVAKGRSSSSVAYGYRRVIQHDEHGEPIRGLREIDPITAPIVQRIFTEYAAGQSTMQIVKRLNAEGVPPPRSGCWRPSTLIGDRRLRNSLLSNPIYIGKLLYGRTRQVMDPRTRQRRMKPGDGMLHEGDAPHLRIIDDTLWSVVQREMEARHSPHPERQRRPRHILSGLGKCGICGGNWIITRSTYWGCSRAVGGAACSNRRLITTKELEQRVIDDLKNHMLAPDVVKAYLREYHRRHAEESAVIHRDRAALDRKLAEADRKIARLVAAIAEGGSAFPEIRAGLADAKRERDTLAKEIASIEAMPVLTLHPGLADTYRREIADLASSLHDEHSRIEAIPRLRKLISRFIATPSAGSRGVDLQIIRQIDEVLEIARSPEKRRALR